MIYHLLQEQKIPISNLDKYCDNIFVKKVHPQFASLTGGLIVAIDHGSFDKHHSLCIRVDLVSLSDIKVSDMNTLVDSL